MAPRSAAQFDEMRQRSRGKIMEAALELFVTYGYQGTTISQIAKKASVSKGLLYNYFKSKEDLLHEIIRAHMEEGRIWLEFTFQMDASPHDKLRFAVEKSIELVQKDIRHWQLLTALAFQPDILKGMEEEMASQQAEFFPQLVKIFTEMGMPDPTKEAWLYSAQLDGMFMHYMNMPDQYPLEEMTEYLLHKYEPYRPNNEQKTK
jgi:AcrR family transcriptional regulator